jgi:nitroimidazol reductase NimA-like FMN-containing flavoprotein (pyridoxamine 5'-phosphate oxidase superfamily)
MEWTSFMAERPLAVVSTVSADGTPHAVPVEVVVDDAMAYVWCHGTSVKARNAARTGRAALVAYKGHSFALVRGAAAVLDATHPDYERITRSFLTKYDRGETFGNDTLIRITPERAIARIY